MKIVSSYIFCLDNLQIKKYIYYAFICIIDITIVLQRNEITFSTIHNNVSLHHICVSFMQLLQVSTAELSGSIIARYS